MLIIDETVNSEKIITENQLFQWDIWIRMEEKNLKETRGNVNWKRLFVVSF